jgi:hypothetical protein
MHSVGVYQRCYQPADADFIYRIRVDVWILRGNAYLAKHGKPLAFYSDKTSIFLVNHVSATGGDGHTQFSRALYELNIDGICANTPSAKGRVERAHLTMQDRLVKELRLECISTIEGANAFMPTYAADYNALFAKVPRETHDAHRPIRDDEDLDLIFSWREQRKVTSNLTLHYERKLYLLQDTPENRRYAGKYLDVHQFPDGRIEIRAAGVSVPYSTYDKLGAIDQGAIVDNKRIGHALRISHLVQARSSGDQATLCVDGWLQVVQERGYHDCRHRARPSYSQGAILFRSWPSAPWLVAQSGMGDGTRIRERLETQKTSARPKYPALHQSRPSATRQLALINQSITLGGERRFC